LELAREIRGILGTEWVDYVWASPSPDFVNSLSEEHVAALQRIEAEERTGRKPHLSISDTAIKEDPMLTPPSDVEKQLA
jgi:hypothetical protein